MSDPTGMKEFRTPSGEIVWISPAAVEAAKESSMSRETMIAGSDKTLTEAPASGLFQIGRGVFRYKRGDKIPIGATHLKDGIPRKINANTTKKSPTPSANQKGAGPKETS